MPDITIIINKDLLRKSKKYSKSKGISLEALVQELLQREVEQKNTLWLDELFVLMDKAKANSKGGKWAREDLYRDL